MILNRLGLNNLIEPIAKDLEFQLQDPFLLYRNAKTRSKSVVKEIKIKIESYFVVH